MPPPDREEVMETREEEDFTAAPIEDQLVRFYQNLNPSKLKVIPFLLAKYGTRVVEGGEKTAGASETSEDLVATHLRERGCVYRK